MQAPFCDIKSKIANIVNKKLSKTAFSLIRKEQKIEKGKDIKLKGIKFLNLFQIRQMLRERRTAITVVLGMVISMLIFCTVMYLMLNVMVERASFGITLIKIFGYRAKEVRKLYLNGNTYVIALGAVVGIPVTKYIADVLYPAFIANTAMGMDLTFSWYLYVGIFVGIMLIYFIINSILSGKLKKIQPVEVLKNRE